MRRASASVLVAAEALRRGGERCEQLADGLLPRAALTELLAELARTLERGIAIFQDELDRSGPCFGIDLWIAGRGGYEVIHLRC